MRITAIIVTRDRRPVLEETLGAILEQRRPPDQICIIDNASVDDTAAVVRERWPALDLIESDVNLGSSGGLALGCARHLESTDALLLLDDDSRPPPEMLGALEAVLSDDGTIGVVGSHGATLRWGNPQEGQNKISKNRHGDEN